MAVFISYPYIDSHLKYSVTILDRVDFKNHRTVSKVPSPEEIRKSKVKVTEILTFDELFPEDAQAQSHFIKDGKIHLMVVIRQNDMRGDIGQREGDSNPAKKFFDAMSHADSGEIVTLRTMDGSEFKVVRSILIEKSVYFQKMFETEMREKSEGVVNVKDFSGAAVCEFLKFMCIGEIDAIENVDKELYEMAKVYEVEELLKKCLSSIESRIDAEHVVDILKFAYLHEIDGLFEQCYLMLAW